MISYDFFKFFLKLYAPPLCSTLLMIAFSYRSVSAGSALATDNENDSLYLKTGFPLRVFYETSLTCENGATAQSSMRGPQEC
jgi:hypothetical protein